jgi:hypothetical protein
MSSSGPSPPRVIASRKSNTAEISTPATNPTNVEELLEFDVVTVVLLLNMFIVKS